MGKWKRSSFDEVSESESDNYPHRWMFNIESHSKWKEKEIWKENECKKSPSKCPYCKKEAILNSPEFEYNKIKNGSAKE